MVEFGLLELVRVVLIVPVRVVELVVLIVPVRVVELVVLIVPVRVVELVLGVELVLMPVRWPQVPEEA